MKSGAEVLIAAVSRGFVDFRGRPGFLCDVPNATLLASLCVALAFFLGPRVAVCLVVVAAPVDPFLTVDFLVRAIVLVVHWKMSSGEMMANFAAAGAKYAKWQP